MKKARKGKKATRQPVKPVSPVIAVRVEASLYEQIKAAAKDRSMSETVADFIRNGMQWSDAFGEHLSFFKREREEVRRLIAGDIKAAMRAKGWVPLHGSPYWIDPDALVLQSGFQEINTELDAIEDRVRKLRSSNKDTGK